MAPLRAAQLGRVKLAGMATMDVPRDSCRSKAATRGIFRAMLLRQWGTNRGWRCLRMTGVFAPVDGRVELYSGASAAVRAAFFPRHRARRLRQRPLPNAFGIHGGVHVGDEPRR